MISFFNATEFGCLTFNLSCFFRSKPGTSRARGYIIEQASFVLRAGLCLGNVGSKDRLGEVIMAEEYEPAAFCDLRRLFYCDIALSVDSLVYNAGDCYPAVV